MTPLQLLDEFFRYTVATLMVVYFSLAMWNYCVVHRGRMPWWW